MMWAEIWDDIQRFTLSYRHQLLMFFDNLKLRSTEPSVRNRKPRPWLWDRSE